MDFAFHLCFVFFIRQRKSTTCVLCFMEDDIEYDDMTIVVESPRGFELEDDEVLDLDLLMGEEADLSSAKIDEQSINESQAGACSTSYYPINRTKRIHPSTIRLPEGWSKQSIDILSLFSQFFSFEITRTIVQNTNEYAELHAHGGVTDHWTPLTRGELFVYLAILIYLSYAHSGPLEDIWAHHDFSAPSHAISTYMSLRRFKQV